MDRHSDHTNSVHSYDGDAVKGFLLPASGIPSNLCQSKSSTRTSTTTLIRMCSCGLPRGTPRRLAYATAALVGIGCLPFVLNYGWSGYSPSHLVHSPPPIVPVEASLTILTSSVYPNPHINIQTTTPGPHFRGTSTESLSTDKC